MVKDLITYYERIEHECVVGSSVAIAFCAELLASSEIFKGVVF